MIKESRRKPTQTQIDGQVNSLVTKHPGLRTLKADILKHHRAYERDYKNCPVTKDVTLDSLKDRYAYIRDSIIELFFNGIGNGTCIYCGLANCAELDHFHPKTPVPQYSILPSNLFWCCDPCNKKKDDMAPLSDLKLAHPMYAKLFARRKILFDVKLNSLVVDKKSGELIFGLDVAAAATLKAKPTRDINVILRRLEIKKRVSDRVASKIRSFHKTVKNSRKTLRFWQSHCRSNVSTAINSNNYTDYFAYRILSKKSVLKKILK